MSEGYDFLNAVSRKYGDSFYVFDADLFRKNYLSFRDGMRRHYANSDVAYAYKANYLPSIGRILAEVHGVAEVVSRFEYDLARHSLAANRLIFNGPAKRREDILFALRSGSQVNLDSLTEVEFMADLNSRGERFQIGLRISAAKADGSESRFGLSVGAGELHDALAVLDRCHNISINSLHCHLSSATKRPEEYVERLELLWSIAKQLAPRHGLHSINLGGGFFGILPDSLARQFACAIPTIDEYTAAIGGAFSAMCPDGRISLLIEPGVSIVANTMYLAARVMDVHRRDGVRQAVLNTSILSVNPTRSSLQAPLSVVAPQRRKAPQREIHSLVGNTCMEHDVIASNVVSDLDVGDFVVFANRGAYSINYTPDFIHPAPAVVDSHGRLLKAPDDVMSVLASYVADERNAQLR